MVTNIRLIAIIFEKEFQKKIIFTKNEFTEKFRLIQSGPPLGLRAKIVEQS